MNEIHKLWNALDGHKLGTGHRLCLDRYRDNNNRPALQAYTEDGDPECSITVNLPNQLGEDQFFVKFETRRIAPEIFEALIAEGLAEPSGRVVSAGFVREYAEVWKLKGSERDAGSAHAEENS